MQVEHTLRRINFPHPHRAITDRHEKLIEGSPWIAWHSLFDRICMSRFISSFPHSIIPSQVSHGVSTSLPSPISTPRWGKIEKNWIQLRSQIRIVYLFTCFSIQSIHFCIPPPLQRARAKIVINRVIKESRGAIIVCVIAKMRSIFGVCGEILVINDSITSRFSIVICKNGCLHWENWLWNTMKNRERIIFRSLATLVFPIMLLNSWMPYISSCLRLGCPPF